MPARYYTRYYVVNCIMWCCGMPYGFFLSTCWACSANGPVTSTCSASGLDGKFHLWPHLFCLKFINFTHNLSKFSSKLLFWVNFGQFYQKWPEFIKNGLNFVKVAPFLSKWPGALWKISGLSNFPLARSGLRQVKKKNHTSMSLTP